MITVVLIFSQFDRTPVDNKKTFDNTFVVVRSGESAQNKVHAGYFGSATGALLGVGQQAMAFAKALFVKPKG